MFMLGRSALSPFVGPASGTVARLYTGTETEDHGGGFGSGSAAAAWARTVVGERDRCG